MHNYSYQRMSNRIRAHYPPPPPLLSEYNDKIITISKRTMPEPDDKDEILNDWRCWLELSVRSGTKIRKWKQWKDSKWNGFCLKTRISRKRKFSRFTVFGLCSVFLIVLLFDGLETQVDADDKEVFVHKTLEYCAKPCWNLWMPIFYEKEMPQRHWDFQRNNSILTISI